MSIELKDKLYTSTQVAEILGVSLRTLYRYMEDSRIASMRTASGRHRFTKDQILDFLNGGEVDLSEDTETYTNTTTKEEQKPSLDSVTSPSVDSFSKHKDSGSLFSSTATVNNNDNYSRQSDDLFAKEDLKPLSIEEDDIKDDDDEFVDEYVDDFDDDIDLEDDPIVAENPARKGPFSSSQVEEKKVYNDYFKREETQVSSANDFSRKPVEEKVSEPVSKPAVEEMVDMGTDLNFRYYKSDNTDLIRLAKKIAEVASSKDLEYAFSGYAGLSLHFLIKPFTLLHFYANPEDMQIWKEELNLTPVSKKEDANIGVIVNTDIVFVPTKEMGNFKVVEDKVLLRDLSDHREDDLVRQFRLHLANSAS